MSSSIQARTVVVTGAFGNLGQRVLAELRTRGYHITATDLATATNRKVAELHPTLFDAVVWSDVRKLDWPKIVSGAKAVIHLAAILPPKTDTSPDLARAINLDATLRLIAALEAQPLPAQLVFPSSVTVFGYPTSTRLRKADETPLPSDPYTEHKVAIEERLAKSSIPWSVLRIGVSVDGNIRGADKEMTKRLFDTAAGNPVEYVHPADVALAAVNALDNPEALARIWLIGGGASCRVTQYDLLSAPMAAMGVTLPRSMLGTGQFYTHWMDTSDSQKVLQFQRHSFDDFRRELVGTIGRWRPIARFFAPLILWGLKRSLR